MANESTEVGFAMCNDVPDPPTELNIQASISAAHTNPPTDPIGASFPQFDGGGDVSNDSIDGPQLHLDAGLHEHVLGCLLDSSAPVSPCPSSPIPQLCGAAQSTKKGVSPITNNAGLQLGQQVHDPPK